ncbi:MAG: hypothetical protein KDA85_02995 [Planctomycetaceae bacterium]|nr:hypothetical protein [Planctomycetaceae bacterium]
MIIFGGFFLVIVLLALGTSPMILRFFRRNTAGSSAATSERHASDADGPARKRAREVVAHQSPGAEAYKCRNCGATVDSTAELSADGKIRCNYCNSWSSIYQ